MKKILYTVGIFLISSLVTYVWMVSTVNQRVDILIGTDCIYSPTQSIPKEAIDRLEQTAMKACYNTGLKYYNHISLFHQFCRNNLNVSYMIQAECAEGGQ